jgi:Arc/MetJ family transcription regulator
MTKTLINVDDELLAAAQGLLGTTTKKDTVNAALRELLRRQAAADFVALSCGATLTGRYLLDGSAVPRLAFWTRGWVCPGRLWWSPP